MTAKMAMTVSLCEKCFPLFELKLRSKSPYSVRIWENTDQKKLRIWTLFTQCVMFRSSLHDHHCTRYITWYYVTVVLGFGAGVI